MKVDRIHSFTLAAALAIGLAACPGVSHAQDLVNGSFEDPVEATNSITEITATGIPGWTGDSIAGKTHEYIINGNVEDLNGNNYGNPEFGSQYLGLNAVANNSFRSIETQVVTGFTVGQTYAITVYIANLDGASDPNISVSASEDSGTGTLLASQTFSAPKGEGPYGNGTIDFVPETLTFTALDSTVSFSIGNQSKTGVMAVDNVSLASVVPEPSVLATALLGVGALTVVVIRRRAQTKLTA